LSRLAAERPDVAECEVNPLRVGPDGALAVDALIIATEAGAGTTPRSGPGESPGRRRA
jgi:hypothetical protein